MNLDKCIMFKVLLSKVLKSQYFLKAHILVFWIRQWGTCFCRVRCSGGSISLPISRCISLWAHRSVSLHSIVSRTFYFFSHILYFLHIYFFCTLCFWSPNAHQPSSHCWFNTFFLHSPLLQHRTECIAPLLALLCSGLLVSWSPGLVCPQPCLNCRDLDTVPRQKHIIIIIDLGFHHHCLSSYIEYWPNHLVSKTIRVSEALQKPPGKNLENANNRLENLPTSDIHCFLLLLICSSSDNVQTDRRTRLECGKSGRQHIKLFDEMKTKTSFSEISVAEICKDLSPVADIKRACYTEKDMLLTRACNKCATLWRNTIGARELFVSENFVQCHIIGRG